MDPVVWWTVLGITIGIAVGFALGEVITFLFRRQKSEPAHDPTLNLRLAHAETESANWKQKCFDLQAEAALTTDRTQMLVAEADRLRKDLVGQSETISGLRSELASASSASETEDLRSRLHDAEEESSRFQSELESVRLALSGAEAAARAEVESLRDELQTARDESESLRAEAASVRESLTDASAASRELESARNDLEALRNELNTAREGSDRLHAELSSLKEAHSSASGMAEELSGARAEIDTLKAEVQSARQASESLMSELTSLRAARHEESLTSSQLAGAREEIESLKAELARAAATWEELERARRQTEEANHVIAEKTGELDALRHDLDSALVAAQASGELERKVRDLEGHVANLQHRLSGSEAENEGLRSEAEALRRETEVQRQKLDEANSLRQKADVLERDVESLKLVSASKDQAVAESIENLRKIEAQLAYRPTAEEVAKLQSELDARRSTIAELQERIERAIESPPVSAEPEPEPEREPEPVPIEPEAVHPEVVSEPRDEEPEPVFVAQSTDEPQEEAVEPVAVTIPPPQTFEPTSTPGQDPLVQIIGIGHLYERKLRDAGIQTFADLAAMSPDRIMEIIQPAEWQRIEPERWIEEAARLAGGPVR